MFARNSLLSLLRTKGKTALFWILLFVLTLLLGMGFSIWDSVEGFLKKCDDFYTSVGVLEYRGSNYPNDLCYDSYMQSENENLDLSEFLKDKAVESFEWSDKRMGIISGFSRKDAGVFNKSEAVIVIGGIRDSGMDYDGNTVYWASVYDTLYSQEDHTGLLVMIEQDGKYELDTTKTYLAHGEFYYGRSAYPHFRVTEFTCKADEALEATLPSIEEVTRTNGKYDIPEDSPFRMMAEILEVRNNSIIVESSSNIKGVTAFHQQLIRVTEGEPFTLEQYENEDKVCLISKRVADMMGISLGQSIELSTVYRDNMDIYQAYLPDTGYDETAEYKIVGIFEGSLDYSFYIYLPKNAENAAMKGTQAGYSIARFILKNNQAVDFEQRLSATLQGRYKFTVYDQGYEAASKAYYSILMVTRIATILCLVVSIAVIILFGYLFVYRQRENAEIMVLLGTVPKKIVYYFTFGSELVAVSAALFGGLLGIALQGKLMSMITALAEKLKMEILPYSEMKNGVMNILDFSLEGNSMLFLLIGIGVALAAFFSIVGFVMAALHRKQGEGRKVMQLKPVKKSSGLTGNAFKYSLLSLRRGNIKSILVPVLAFLAVIFMATLVRASNGYKERLDEVNSETTINAYFTDIQGKGIRNLVVTSRDVAEVYFNGGIEALNAEWSTAYYYLTSQKDNPDYENTHLMVPENTYEAEVVRDKIDRGFDLIFTNSLKNTADFYFSREVNAEYMDGYDESFLATMPEEEIPCMVSRRFLDANNLEFGDVFKIVYNEASPDGWFYEFDMKVVGTYQAQGEEDSIYCPLAIYFNPAFIWGGTECNGTAEDNGREGYVPNDEEKWIMQYNSFQTVTFKVNASKLEKLRQYMRDFGFSQVGESSLVREFVVIEDKLYLNAVSNLEQQILYTDYLYPVLYILVLLMGMTVSYLLTTGRRPEIALMRGMGSRKGRIVLTFLSEQFLLCGFGIAVSLLVWRIAAGRFYSLQLILAGSYLGLYLFCCLLSLLKSNHMKLSTMLADKDE